MNNMDNSLKYENRKWSIALKNDLTTLAAGYRVDAQEVLTTEDTSKCCRYKYESQAEEMISFYPEDLKSNFKPQKID